MNSIKDMEYHYAMLEAMGVLDRAIINVHIGGAYGDKKVSLRRFHHNIKRLSNHIKKIMTLGKLQVLYQKSIFHRRSQKKNFVHMRILSH